MRKILKSALLSTMVVLTGCLFNPSITTPDNFKSVKSNNVTLKIDTGLIEKIGGKSVRKFYDIESESLFNIKSIPSGNIVYISKNSSPLSPSLLKKRRGCPIGQGLS